MREDLLETLRAGPGEAARQEVAVEETGPVPSRWTLRTIRASVAWLTEYTLSGVWRVLQTCGLGLHASCARLFSPDPAYRSKVRRLHRCLRDAARHPDTVVALFLDEFGYQRWPEVAPTWGSEAAVAQRAGNNQQWRTIGALNALTGQVNDLDGYRLIFYTRVEVPAGLALFAALLLILFFHPPQKAAVSEEKVVAVPEPV